MTQKINVVCYASGRFVESQKILEKQSYLHGADKVFTYKRKDLDLAFIKKNRQAFSYTKGDGYWIWKPYFIQKTLKQLPEDDILIYLDSGAYPIEDYKNLPLFEDIISFESYDQEHKNWTKYDCYYLMDCLEEKYFTQKERWAGLQIYRNNKKAREFVDEYLYFCELFDNACLTDDASKYGKEEFSFKEHRHDQSIYTNLCIKYNIKGHRDPSQWGNQYKKFYDDKYEQVLNLHRGII
jgi:hypothetical protein